jgi:hypothetical protein
MKTFHRILADRSLQLANKKENLKTVQITESLETAVKIYWLLRQVRHALPFAFKEVLTAVTYDPSGRVWPGPNKVVVMNTSPEPPWNWRLTDPSFCILQSLSIAKLSKLCLLWYIDVSGVWFRTKGSALGRALPTCLSVILIFLFHV